MAAVPETPFGRLVNKFEVEASTFLFFYSVLLYQPVSARLKQCTPYSWLRHDCWDECEQIDGYWAYVVPGSTSSVVLRTY